MAKAEDTQAKDPEPVEAPALVVGPAKVQSEADAAHDAASAAARQAELDRQQAIVDAVAGSGDELAKLGGPTLYPGLGSSEPAPERADPTAP